MTLAHFIYIPGILLLGIVIGWVLAGRVAEHARREGAQRDARRAAREARRRAEQARPE